MHTNIRTFVRLYWIRILLVVSGFFLLILLIALVGFGTAAFFEMESFYKKAALSSMPFQIYFTIIGALAFASIYMTFHYWFFFGGGISKITQKKVKAEKVNIHWDEVIGLSAVKKEVWEVIRLVKDRTQVKKVGGKIIRGVLLYGPPGCGKTYLAKAIATETHLPFLHASGSDFVGIFVGVGTARLKSIFKKARVMAELHGGCIVFLDEVDSIARPRMGDMGFGAGIDHNATVNQLLTEMDGISNMGENVVVIAATNVHTSEFDPALMRPGRFDRKVYVGRPGLRDREEILKFYLAKIQYDKNSIDISKLARLTVGDSPSDISNMIREASLIAVRKRKTIIAMDDLYEAQERIHLGIKTERNFSDKDKIILAYHESGHAMVAYLLVPTRDVFKASIIPREFSGGATWAPEREEIVIPTKEDLLGRIKISLGGYAAEKIHFGTTSIGTEDDLSKATRLAERMVTEWGMGTSGVAGISENTWFLHDVAKSDKETIINNSLDEVSEILRKEKVILDEIAQMLLSKEELNYDELEEIFKKHGKTRLTYSHGEGEKAGIKWNDVIGMDAVKEEAQEIVTLIKDRAMIQQIGGQIIRGLLMFGKPGCGKTYLASAMANEAGVPFILRSGSEFVEKYVGVGASRIRQLFQEAKEKAMAKGGCIIFIDEIDALGARRESGDSGGNREYNQTLNQFLVEMDGLKEKDARYNIVVIGATNVKERFLDPALLRPGRFDRHIIIDLPTWEDRKNLFAYYLGKIKYNPDEINPEKFASMTRGWTPADVANITREAALLAIRNKKQIVGIKEIDEARERILLGLKRKLKQSETVKRQTAYHEAGHVIAGYFCKGKETFPFKVSIIPRTRTLGVAWYAFEGDTPEGTREELRGHIMGCLAGFAAEKIKFNTTTQGVYIDFENALKIAHFMVWAVGMGKSGLLGNFYAIDEISNQGKLLVSEETKAKLDREAQDILQDCLKETEELLKRELSVLDHLSEELLKKEELTYNEIEEIFKKYAKGPSPDTSI